jgi:hypothetical protein
MSAFFKPPTDAMNSTRLKGVNRRPEPSLAMLILSSSFMQPLTGIAPHSFGLKCPKLATTKILDDCPDTASANPSIFNPSLRSQWNLLTHVILMFEALEKAPLRLGRPSSMPC